MKLKNFTASTIETYWLATKKLPLILTKEEVNIYINSFESLKYKSIVSTMYSSGMRVSEALHLRY